MVVTFAFTNTLSHGLSFSLSGCLSALGERLEFCSGADLKSLEGVVESKPRRQGKKYVLQNCIFKFKNTFFLVVHLFSKYKKKT